MSRTGSPDLVNRVQAVLDKASAGKDRPTDADLGPCFSFLIPPASSASSSSLASEHWYCDKAKSELHRRAAGYLLFLFAFKRSGQSKEWVDRLEIVLKGCEACARAFGIARRAFGDLYMSTFPQANKVNFFAAVDRWQATFVLEEAARAPGTTYDSASIDNGGLGSLSTPITQLLFAEPSLLSTPEIAHFIDNGISDHSQTVLTNVVSLGVTPMLVRLLRSPDQARRDWASVQLSATARRKLSFELFVSTGVRDEIEAICNDHSTDEATRWGIILEILKSGGLRDEAVAKGLLARENPDGSRKVGGGILSSLVSLLGLETDHFPVLLDVFTLLLDAYPDRSFWTFDPSPELPYSLAGDIKSNPAFRSLLEGHFSSLPGSTASPSLLAGSKGKEKTDKTATPFGWISDYLASLVTVRSNPQQTPPADSGFSEAVARIMGDLLQDYQHDRFPVELRAAAAQAGLDTLSELQQRSGQMTETCEIALQSVLEVHAKFITAVAFRMSDYPEPTWGNARISARDLLSNAFRADTKDVLESMLGLSIIASAERRRHQLVRKAKQRGETPPAAIPVKTLHRASVRKELWAAAYNALSPTDAAGAAIMLNSMVSYAHVEKLNRDETWNYSGLKLQEVVKEEDYVSAIRAINSGLVASRDPFSRAMESMAIQADLSIVKRLWDQPGVAKSAVILLLSPDEEVHDSIISLIQQSFDNVDDRADCFRILLMKYPSAAMDGLCAFLGSFIDTAKITPESCSLAKWLVRCFTDILDALCQASEESEPLLQSSTFLAAYADGLPMSRRVGSLWHLMTNALGVIFKRTVEWAPFYDNETMVDWMRDALIFGRHMADHIRAFEAAALGVVGARFESESPARGTTTGTKLVQRLGTVLRDLVAWLRLTDVETLHQTFELIRTIVGRVEKVTPDIKKSPDLELTLLELDKFSRKASKSYRTRLSDDLLSELSDMLTPFNLDIEDDEEIQYVKSVASAPAPSAEPRSGPVRPASSSSRPSAATSSSTAAKPKNAFEAMMQRAGGTKTISSSSSPATSKPTSAPSKPKTQAPPEVVEIDDDEFDDGFLDDVSAADLDNLEANAKSAAATPAKPKYPTPAAKAPPRPPSGQAPLRFPPKMATSSTTVGQKLNIDLVHRAQPKSSSTGFKSSFMKEAGMHHRMAKLQRDRNIGGITPKTPAASGLGSGLGAYQGPRKPVQPLDSGSSASESSDEERQGVNALAARQKSPKKIVRTAQPERRRVQVLGGDGMAELLRQREDKRAAQHRLKMRLKPDLNGLYRYVLAWDPEHQGQSPPHPPVFAREIGSVGQVPTTFGDCVQYRKVMLPLFLQELWMQCLNDKTNSESLPVEVASRAYEDDFLDMEITVLGNLPQGWYANETDVVVLRCIGSSAKPVLAKVQGFRRKFGKDGALKLRILSNRDQKELGVKSRWQLRKHVSLSTALREYGALQGLPYYDPALLMNILGARSAMIPTPDRDDIDDAIKAFDVNEPQAKAILGAMSVEGFALIQGPPGTGKTKTISGLVGKWMSDRSGIIPIMGEKPSKSKLLVCAPSNAAIDEVCKRLMNGVPTSSGGTHHPTIVRIGVESSVNIAVKSVSLDSLVEARVLSSGGGKDGSGDHQRIQAELDSVKGQITIKHDELSKVGANEEKRKQLENEYHSLIQKRTQLGQQSSKAKDAARDATRHLEGARRAAREAILGEADIVCATLSGAGQDSLAQFGFETVIIDEAAQAIEMSCLIPLKYGCKRCIMVGDPNQLPPTTFSSDAERFHYNESLFVRMVKQNPRNVQLLSIQYRMHPFISELPSKVFYDGKLEDGPAMDVKTKAIWHERPIYGPYRFFNVNGVETKRYTSTINTEEALKAVDLYRRLEAEFGDRVNFAMRIGVITMYKEQLFELKRKFMDVYGPGIIERIEFNTVDGFQGQEKDIIILSCVRSGPNLQSIGFLRDVRRMNVALTRAKSSLFVIGNGATLERSDERWRTIVLDAKERGFYVDYGPEAFSKGWIEPPKVKAEKVDKAPAKSATPAKIPPKEEMDLAQPLKRKNSDGAKADKKDKHLDKKRKSDGDAVVDDLKVKREEGVEDVTEKRKVDRADDRDSKDSSERKKKKKNKEREKERDKDRTKDRVKEEEGIRSTSPATTLASNDPTRKPPGPAPPKDTSGRSIPPPPPPTSKPPGIPPPPPPTGPSATSRPGPGPEPAHANALPGRAGPSVPAPPPKIPPPPPARKPEDVLFHKKKKKPGQTGFVGAAAHRAPIQNVRATFKEQFSKGGSRP